MLSIHINFVLSSVKEKEWAIAQRRVAIFCKEGRIPGAALIGDCWLWPSDAKKQEEPRKIRN